MSTRSLIGHVRKDGTVEAVYCHSDGYPSYQMGKLMHYDNDNAVAGLLTLGDMSVLGSTIGKKHSFEDRGKDDICTFYGRDRGETGTEPRTFSGVQELLDKADNYSAEYVYLFREGGWGMWEQNYVNQEYLYVGEFNCLAMKAFAAGKKFAEAWEEISKWPVIFKAEHDALVAGL